jgi:hypothetical protein
MHCGVEVTESSTNMQGTRDTTILAQTLVHPGLVVGQAASRTHYNSMRQVYSRLEYSHLVTDLPQPQLLSHTMSGEAAKGQRARGRQPDVTISAITDPSPESKPPNIDQGERKKVINAESKTIPPIDTEAQDASSTPCSPTHVSTIDARQQSKRQPETPIEGDPKRQKLYDFKNNKTTDPIFSVQETSGAISVTNTQDVQTAPDRPKKYKKPRSGSKKNQPSDGPYKGHLRH